MLMSFGFVGLATLIPVFFGLLSRSPSQSAPAANNDSKDSTNNASSQSPSPPLGLQSPWARRPLVIAHLGFLGFLCNLPGRERAAGMFGFFGFTGVATFFEFRARYTHRRVLRTVVTVLVILPLVAVPAAYLIEMMSSRQTAQAIVVTQDVAVDQGHFSFCHEVTCPDGWNVWLTLECVQLFRSNTADNEVREPSLVKRYQAKLDGRGRIRIPLDYLPTTDENRGKMQASIGPLSGTTSYPSPGQDYSLLAYTTE